MSAERETRPVTDLERVDILRTLTGKPHGYCDTCSERVTEANLATWDQDGHVYCNQHGRGTVKFRTGEVYHD